MTVRVLDPRTVTRHIAQVLVDDLVVTTELIELLEELQTCDGYTSRLLIHDSREAKDLEARGLAVRHNKGSYYPGPKLEEWLKEHTQAVYRGLAESHQRAYPFNVK